jgi:hypothetical protein
MGSINEDYEEHNCASHKTDYNANVQAVSPVNDYTALAAALFLSKLEHY